LRYSDPVHDDEERFRAALDARGLARPGAIAEPARDDAYTVFVQRADARVEIDAWRAYAERFFGVAIGLTVDKRYAEDAPAPTVDAARVVVAPAADPAARAKNPAAGTRGVCLVYGRLARDEDHAAAEGAEAREGFTGLAALARRCQAVWLVALDRAQGDQRLVPLLVATILAGVGLGPILSPGARALLGVKTARRLLSEGLV
jgi:hypothetical protein